MHMLRRLLFIVLVLFFYPISASAQDNNLLAKLAYENAETALSEKKFTEGISELKKVDELLGKLTPRSQFLRVQLWIGAAEANPVYLDSAIEQSKKYLALSKLFDIPEEKQLETLRQLQKMEKDKSVYEKKAEEEKAANAILQKVEQGAAIRDQAVVAVLAGLDLNNDVLDQLTKTGRLSKKDVNYWKKAPQSLTTSYLHKGIIYSMPVNVYSELYATKKEPYRINGLETDMLVDAYFTTTGGAFQEMRIGLLKRMPDIETYTNQVSAILGFKPDAQVVIDSKLINNYNYSILLFWSFKDYTVSLLKYSDEWTKAKGYTHSLSIVRHYPGIATLRYKQLIAPYQ